MIGSLTARRRVNPGFSSHAITFSLSLLASPTTVTAETRARLRQLDAKMFSIPGVQAISATLGSRPMQHDSSESFWIEGQPKPAEFNDMHQSLFTLVEPGFQKAMGITLERGRFIALQDDENSPIVIIVDDVLAHQFFPNQNPIGKHVDMATFGVLAEIVGVVRHGDSTRTRTRLSKRNSSIPSCSFQTKSCGLLRLGSLSCSARKAILGR